MPAAATMGHATVAVSRVKARDWAWRTRSYATSAASGSPAARICFRTTLASSVKWEEELSAASGLEIGLRRRKTRGLAGHPSTYRSGA